MKITRHASAGFKVHMTLSPSSAGRLIDGGRCRSERGSGCCTGVMADPQPLSVEGTNENSPVRQCRVQSQGCAESRFSGTTEARWAAQELNLRPSYPAR